MLVCRPQPTGSEAVQENVNTDGCEGVYQNCNHWHGREHHVWCWSVDWNWSAYIWHPIWSKATACLHDTKDQIGRFPSKISGIRCQYYFAMHWFVPVVWGGGGFVRHFHHRTKLECCCWKIWSCPDHPGQNGLVCWIVSANGQTNEAQRCPPGRPEARVPRNKVCFLYGQHVRRG